MYLCAKFEDEIKKGDESMKITKGKVYIFLLMCIGNLFLGLGVALLRLADFGTDPYSCMNIGMSGQLGLTYGTFQLIMNLILFVPAIIVVPKTFGVGAFINMIGIGYIADFFMWFWGGFGFTIEVFSGQLIARIIIVLIGILVFCFGIGLYMACDMGVAPYDAVGLVLEKLSKGKLVFRWMRVVSDVICMIVGYISGGTLGVITIIVAFFAGPLVSWYREKSTKLIIRLRG